MVLQIFALWFYDVVTQFPHSEVWKVPMSYTVPRINLDEEPQSSAGHHISELPPRHQASVPDVLTLKMCYLQHRDHEDEIFHHFLELHLEKLRVLIVPHVLLHHQVTKFRRPHLAQRGQGESDYTGLGVVRPQSLDDKKGLVWDKLNQERTRFWAHSTHK